MTSRRSRAGREGRGRSAAHDWRPPDPCSLCVTLLAVVPACSSPSTPTSSTSSSRPATTSTSTTSSVAIPEGSAAEVAACQADAKTLETALETYMVQKGSFPSPAPWSAATYAANFEPLTAAGGGGPVPAEAPGHEVLRDRVRLVRPCVGRTTGCRTARRSTPVRASTPAPTCAWPPSGDGDQR